MSSSPTSSARRPWFRRVVLLTLVLLILAGAYAGWKKWLGAKNPRDEYQIATVQKGDIQDLVTATGTVQPRDYVDVGAQVSGQLKKLHVEVGSVVQSGDLLAEIDPTVFSATVEARRAGLRNQQATLKERESALVLATLQFNRQKNLAAEDATTTESLQLAEASLRSARAQIESVKAQIEQTESTLKADEATLNYARIYAPMSGTVVSVTARQGQTLNANQSAPTVLRIADLSTMTVQTQVSEAEVSKLRMGMEVYFTTLGSQGRRWYGALRKVEPTPTVTNNVVLYNALFDVPNNNQALMPSMTTQVFFIAASAEDVLVVPTAAVTMARAVNGQRNRGNAAEAGKGAASASASASASDASSASASKPAPASAPKAPRRDAAAAAPASAPASRAAGDMGRFAGMSPEERRAAFEAMSPEERQAMRDRRRAQRDEQPSQGGGTSQAAAPKAPASAASQAGRGERRRYGERGDRADAPETRASGPVSRGSNAGFSNAGNTRGPRRGTVKVIDAQGRIEERQVELGVTTRVQAQVLSGLAEGDQVITSLKLPPAAQQAQQRGGQQNQGGGLQQGGGNVPGAGGGRSR
jgi:macrolide-specific efflux system membrane fusion protein